MNLQETLLNFLHRRLSEVSPKPFEILSVNPLSGGSINEVYKLQTGRGALVLKLNHKDKYPGMFAAEAKGLEILASAQAIETPQVIDHGEFEDQSYLLMHFIESGSKTHDFWFSFGHGLADLHRKSSPGFGLDHDNYIGSLPQLNTSEDSWAEFFVLHRLEPQLKMAYDAGFFRGSSSSGFSRLIARIPELIPVEKPSLLHGDLWAGNYLVNSGHKPVLIDPAVYYGHREMDIAMMHLFGGFAPEVFEHYNNSYPLEAGWRERVDLHNVYPLLVHVNLFGGSYERQVTDAVSRFI